MLTGLIIVSVLIVAVVLILAVVTTSKAYGVKHTIDSIDNENHAHNPQNEKKTS